MTDDVIPPAAAGSHMGAMADVVDAPIATKRVIPWEDLLAKLVPETYLRITPELLPTLAAMMAQGPTAPVLLQADALKRLQVAADLNPIQQLAAAAAIGAATLTVQTPSSFRVGQLIRVLPMNAAGVLTGTGEYHTVSSIGASNIGILPIMSKAAGVGSLVAAVSQVMVSTPDRLIGNFTVGSGSGQTFTYDVDPDVQGIRVVCTVPSQVTLLEMAGTLAVYVQVFPPSIRADNVYRFPSALENKVQVHVTTQAGIGTDVYVLAIYDVQNVAAEVRAGDIIRAEPVDVSGAYVPPFGGDVTDRAARLLGRVTEIPPTTWAGGTSTLSTGGEGTMIAAVGGQTVNLEYLSVSCDTAGALGSIRDTSSIVKHPFNLVTAGVPQILPLRGTPLLIGRGLVVHTDNGTNVVYRWSVGYTQA